MFLMNKSNCLHDMRRVSALLNLQGEVHVCRLCKFRAVYPKNPKTGRLDNARYLKDHVRIYAQPGGRTGHIYKRLHGNKKLDTYKPSSVTKTEAAKGWEKLANETNKPKTYL